MSMMHTWFECKVRYEKTLGNGVVKKVTEPYLVDAVSFTEAESRITEEMKPFISGDFKVADIKRANCTEVFECTELAADKWYRCRVAFITVDERSGTERKSSSNILVQAESLGDALERLEEGMKGSLSDWEVTSIVETAIMDIYPYVADGHDEQTKAMEKGAGDVASVTVPETAIRDFADGLKDADPLLGKAVAYLKERRSVGRTEFGMALRIGVKRVAKIVAQLLLRGLIDKDCAHALTYTGRDEE